MRQRPVWRAYRRRERPTMSVFPPMQYHVEGGCLLPLVAMVGVFYEIARVLIAS